MSEGVNYREHQRRILISGAVKIVVVGEPQVGKTSFIRSFWEHHQPEDTYNIRDVKVYPCNYTDNGVNWVILLFDIPGNPEFGLEHRAQHYSNAHAIIWMYAIDGPLTLEMLGFEWLLEARSATDLERVETLLVGNKRDLRDDPQVIQRLAEDNRAPVTSEQAQTLQHTETIRHFSEISAHNLEDVNDVFNTILSHILDFD